MSRAVGLLDYGSGNLHSAARALQKAGADVTVTSDLEQLMRQDALVLPGVGAYSACMAGLHEVGAVELVHEWIPTGKPLLGICVGHQVLFGAGEEGSLTTPGIGVFDGVVAQLPSRRLPHMGWNRVEAPEGSRLFAGIADQRFYFVHSYAVLEAPADAEVSLTRHESIPFVAAVERGNVASTQFHPEKSGAAGAQLLRNWLAS